MNPRYAAYLKTTNEPKNWEYMHFISKMAIKYAESVGLIKDMTGAYHIKNHDEFTAFIEDEVK
jgi:hypothetical protein